MNFANYFQKVKTETSSDPLEFSLDSNDLSALVDSSFLQATEPSTSDGYEKSMDRYAILILFVDQSI